MVPFMKTPNGMETGRFYESWLHTPLAGTAPTTAAVPFSTAVGCLTGGAGGIAGTDLRLLSAQMSSTQPGTFILCDRLSHQGGLSGTVTTAQTTNLPTAALTRYTSGVDVYCGLSIYTQVGTSPTTVTTSYTNQAGTASRTSTAVAFGGTGFRNSSRFVLIPPAAGDTGFRSVESVTVAATTSTAGAFGVTLYKPLAYFVIERPGGQVDFSALDGQGSASFNPIMNDACLFWLYCPSVTSLTFTGSLNFAEV